MVGFGDITATDADRCIDPRRDIDNDIMDGRGNGEETTRAAAGDGGGEENSANIDRVDEL